MRLLLTLYFVFIAAQNAFGQISVSEPNWQCTKHSQEFESLVNLEWDSIQEKAQTFSWDQSQTLLRDTYILWCRFERPGPIGKELHLLNSRYYGAIQVFSGGEKIFSNGFDAQEKFIPSTVMHSLLAKIPAFSASHIYVRFKTNNNRIGIEQAGLIGSQIDLVNFLVRKELIPLIPLIVMLVIGGLSLIMFLFNLKSKEYFYLGVFASGMSLYHFKTSLSFAMFFPNQPIDWAFFLTNVFMVGVLGIIASLYTDGIFNSFKHLKYYYGLFSLIEPIGIVLRSMGLNYLNRLEFLSVFLYLGVLFSIMAIFIEIYRAYKVDPEEGSILGFTIILVSMASIYTVLGRLGIAHPNPQLLPWSLLSMVLAFLFLLGRRFKQVFERSIEAVRFENQLKLSGTIQEMLLPHKVSDDRNFNLESFYKSADESGGDWYYHSNWKHGSFVLLCDITGHGVQAAMLTASIAGAVRNTKFEDYESEHDFEILFQQLDHLLKDLTHGSFWMTAIAVVRRNDSPTYTIINAGSPPPIAQLENQCKRVPFRSNPLGGELFQISRKEINLSQNERLWLYTDGIYEVANKDKRPLGITGLAKIIRTTSELDKCGSILHILEQVNTFKNEEQFKDDVTILVIEEPYAIVASE